MSNFNNGWNNEIKNKLIDYKKCCEIYTVAHKNNIKFNKKLFNILVILTIVLTTLAAFLGIIGSALSQRVSFISFIIASILSGLCSIITSIMTLYDPLKKTERHTEIAGNYIKIIYEIDCELSINIDKRQDAVIFLKNSDLKKN